MRFRRLYLLALVASVVAAIMCGCDTVDPDTVEDTAQAGSVKLAPPRPDQKVYATPSTGKFHLALCSHLTEDKVVMLVSEAVDQGYEPCEYCFPLPKESEPSAPKVYVVDGDNHYHLAGCVFLDETKQAIPKSEAIEQGYTPCPRCNYGEASPVESRVYILPDDDEHYHINGCPHLNDDKILMLKVEAVEKGYTPCPECAIVVRVPGGLVYITETGKTDGIYHTNPNCKHLDHLDTQAKLAIAYLRWNLPPPPPGKSWTKCKDCDEERHIEEE